ncbi:MAG: hypothetical protein LUQ12_00920 [Methanoregulaceae archaeon]|nr:hypothetical protein [Methanoregulaceae archaeon]
METVQKAMDPRLMDILISVAAFAVFLLLIMVLPFLINPGTAYLAAVIVFIIIMSGAGIMINRKAK